VNQDHAKECRRYFRGRTCIELARKRKHYDEWTAAGASSIRRRRSTI
jgi:hypothetical protein